MKANLLRICPALSLYLCQQEIGYDVIKTTTYNDSLVNITSGLNIVVKALRLTHISLSSLLWDIGKQNSPRCDAAERGVPSGAILFAQRHFIEKGHKNEIIKQKASDGLEVMKLFSCSAQLRLKFVLLITVKMPTVVGILTFMSRINYRLWISKLSI